MKVRLEMELKAKDVKEALSDKVTREQIKEYLTDSLIEVCEDWVLRGQQPDLEFIED